MSFSLPRRPGGLAVALVIGLAASTIATVARADEGTTESWNAHFQSTYVWQRKSAFHADYSGPNSLLSTREKSYSFTATAALGLRPWRGGELYFNPEAAQGVPLSGLLGLGGFTNGEMARTAGSTLKVYRARLFLRQTWNRGADREAVDSDFNQLAGSVSRRRWVLTAGNLSVTDIFDDNRYSHDPRTQFLNWSLVSQGAYDFAADARGYTWGIALEWYHDDWAVRAGRFLQPREPNQQTLDWQAFRHYGDQVEIERGHRLAGQPGRVRLLAFRNRARMSRFDDALALGLRTGTTPDINAVRDGDRTKLGFGINVEQAITDDIGVFGRASRADGKTETYAFTEIDNSLSAGIVAQGSRWQRSNDSAGFALVRNGLSRARRNYLAAGGLGFFIGDGRLDYRPEQVLETWYSLGMTRWSWLTLNWQHIRNPAYNGDRGPVNFIALRLHLEI